MRLMGLLPSVSETKPQTRRADASNLKMNTEQNETRYGCFDGLRGLGIAMTLEEALSCSHQGACDADVTALVKQPRFAAQFETLTADHIREGLKEAGAWDDEELADDEQNRHRALWFAACDIKENEGRD